MFAASKTATMKLSTSAAASLAQPSRRSIAGGIGCNLLCTVRLQSTKSTTTTTNAVKSLSSASATTSTSSTTSTGTNSGSRSSSRSHTTSSLASASSRQQQQQQQQQPGQFKPVYVHHVSRVALEHFQSPPNCDWLLEKGLDSRLKITPNGTFELTFPPLQEQNNGSSTAAGGKIWTSYDPQRKQHWLSVYRHKLAVRFLLKDHTAAAASPNSNVGPDAETAGQHSVQYRTGLQQIQAAVDEMIKAVDRVDHEKLNENLRKNKQQQQRRQREEETAKQQQSSFLLKTLRNL